MRVAFSIFTPRKGGTRLAITRERKEELVAQYGEILRRTDGFIVTHYNRLTVANVTDLRTRLRERSGSFVITKNTLFRIALQNNGWTVPEDLLEGHVAVAFGNGNLPAVAKTLLDFQKDFTEQLQITGGVMGSARLNATEVRTISELPSLDELRAQLAGLIVQPATSLAGVINSATAQLAQVLQAYVQKNEGEAA
jgi:large subunit ribosomal protein L10